MEVTLMFVSFESSPPQKICGNPMENQKEKLREPRGRYTLCLMWNEGNPKEVANCDVNGKKYIEKKEWSEEEVGLDSALPKTARRTNQKKKKKTIWRSSNRRKYFEKRKQNLAVRGSSNDNGFLVAFSLQLGRC